MCHLSGWNFFFFFIFSRNRKSFVETSKCSCQWSPGRLDWNLSSLMSPPTIPGSKLQELSFDVSHQWALPFFPGAPLVRAASTCSECTHTFTRVQTLTHFFLKFTDLLGMELTAEHFTCCFFVCLFCFLPPVYYSHAKSEELKGQRCLVRNLWSWSSYTILGFKPRATWVAGCVLLYPAALEIEGKFHLTPRPLLMKTVHSLLSVIC